MRKIQLMRDEDGRWVGMTGELPGFVARGDTEAEVINRIREALMLYYPCGECDEEKTG